MKDKDRLLSDLANTVAPRQGDFFFGQKLCVEVFFSFFWEKNGWAFFGDDGWMMCVFFFLVGLGGGTFDNTKCLKSQKKSWKKPIPC